MNTVNDVETGGDAHVPNEVLPYSDVVMQGRHHERRGVSPGRHWTLEEVPSEERGCGVPHLAAGGVRARFIRPQSCRSPSLGRHGPPYQMHDAGESRPLLQTTGRRAPPPRKPTGTGQT